MDAPARPQARALRREIARRQMALARSAIGARLALRLPVTGSSGMPLAAAKARTSSSGVVGARRPSRRIPRGRRPPCAQVLEREVIGRKLQHGSAGCQQQCRARPGRCPATCAAMTWLALRPSAAATCASVAGLGALRFRAARRTPGGSPSRRIFTSPALHSCTMNSRLRGLPPASATHGSCPASDGRRKAAHRRA